jgi:hypothetical protein
MYSDINGQRNFGSYFLADAKGPADFHGLILRELSVSGGAVILD